MRTIERTSRFKRDYKRESRGRHRAYLDVILVPVVEAWPTTDRWSLATTTTR